MKFKLLCLLCLLCQLSWGQRIAVLSDVHVTPGNANEKALKEAVEEINSQNFDIVVMNGDLTNEGSDEQLINVKSILDGIRHPLFTLPGNHENNWSQSATKTFVDLWGDDRFVTTLGDSLLVIGINCGPYMKMGDGHIKQEDLHWLKSTLDSRLKPGMRVLSFNHYPIRKDDLDNYISYARVLENYPVITHINGHYHSWIRYDVGELPAAMTRALDMGKGNYGYTIMEISPEWVHIYDKRLGEKAEPMFDYPAKDKHKPLKAEEVAAIENPEGFTVEKVWADSASVFTRLAVDDQAVYFGTSTGIGKAVDAKSGQLKWERPMGASIFSRPVALGNGRVAYPSASGILILDAATGKELKNYPSKEGPYVADGALSADGKAYFQGGYKRFERRDPKNGKLIWSFDSINNYCQAAPAIGESDVIFGAWDTYLRSLDAKTGKLRWKWNNGKTANMLGPGNVVPVINEDYVVIVAPDRYMTMLDRKTGKEIWRNNAHRYRESLGSGQGGKKAYAKTMDGELVCVDATSPEFKELWITDMGLGYEHAPCIVLEQDGVIYAGSRRGLVTALDAASGKTLWQLPLGESEINGFDVAPDGSVWTSLIEGTIFRIAKN
ncbi:MAG: PQQ-binding-like beta-propeller repeat protein [Clostridium sp.]|nr:PQQ-binding-like beta-propeller repeat protein [Clostridium sp.]